MASEKTTAKAATLRVAAVSPRIRLGDVAHNVAQCISEAHRAAAAGARVLVFPRLTLTGATCGDLFDFELLLERAERGLAEYIEATRELDMMSLIGLPARVALMNLNIVAVVYRGELIGVVPQYDLTLDEQKHFANRARARKKVAFLGRGVDFYLNKIIKAPFDESILIAIGKYSFAAKLPHIVAYPETKPAKIGHATDELFLKRVYAIANDTVYVVANSGVGESTTDAVYSAHNLIIDRDMLVAEALPFADDNLVVADVRISDPLLEDTEESIDIDALANDPAWDDIEEIANKIPDIPANPYLSENPDVQKKECLEALEIQAQGLAARMERSYSKAMIIGVSGGLDSTLALLVCARAADILGIDRRSVIGVTMPCFGTTSRTKSNAEKLSEALGISFRTVDIKKSVTQHLNDIGHDGVTTDVTYENAQARERTQVLMDIANMTGGLVVGTGDLSELVLGWATYNGDHMSMYAVNASVPKTMVRRIVEVYSERERESSCAVSDILDDILATPVSPELLPPKDGEIAQCTEELVGPYELHDFFIYCMLKRKLSVREIYERAKESLGDVYDNKTILGWLRVFLRRFFSQQFKRSCMPDGPMVSCISVSPRCGLSMPSDISAAVWLEELEKIEKEEK